jgi:hypothetical protein
LITLFVVIGFGYAVGLISVAGLTLGIGAVLFVGLATGAIASDRHASRVLHHVCQDSPRFTFLNSVSWAMRRSTAWSQRAGEWEVDGDCIHGRCGRRRARARTDDAEVDRRCRRREWPADPRLPVVMDHHTLSLPDRLAGPSGPALSRRWRLPTIYGRAVLVATARKLSFLKQARRS